MQRIEQSSPHKVLDGLQAAAFSSPLRCRVLVACALEERSLSQLQADLGMPLNKLHYHVGRLMQAGLLVISRRQARAGRAITYYRAIAESFLLADVTHITLPSDLWTEELRQLLNEDMNRSEEWGLLYAPGPRGKMLVHLVRPPQSPTARTFENWRVLKLNAQQRVALAKDLADLLERYAKAGSEDGETILLHAAFAPRKSV
jgi:hypothetical protein